MKIKLKTKQIIESDWINNFWFVGDYLYVTDSTFDNLQKNLLGRIGCDNVTAAFETKANFNSSFIANPNAAMSSLFDSNKSDVEVVNYYDGFVYNVFRFKDVTYISIINKDQSSTVLAMTWDSDQLVVKEYNDYLVIGELNNKLVLKSVKTRETYLAAPIEIKNNKVIIVEPINPIETKQRRIKQICYLVDKYVISTDLNHLYALKRGTDEVISLKEDEKEITICNFDKSSFIISDKESKQTYLIDRNNERVDIYDNYFYRLDSYNKVLLIGKPLFMDDVESYTQPLIFVD